MADQIATLGITVRADGAIQQVGQLDNALKRLSSTSEYGTKGMGAMDAMHKELTEHVGEHSLAIGRLEMSLARFAEGALGVNSTVGILSASLSKFAFGAIETAGLLLAADGLIAVYGLMTEGAEKAKKQMDDMTDSLVKQARAAREATVAGRQDLLFIAEMNQQTVSKEPSMGLMGILKGALTGNWAGTAGEHDAQSGRQADAQTAVDQARQNLADAISEQHKKELTELNQIDAAFQKRIDTLVKGLVFDDQRKRITAELVSIEKQLSREVANGTLSIEDRIKASLRLGAVEAALSRKFLTPPNITNAGQLIGITGDGETDAARLDKAYDGPMKNVKYNTDSMGFSVKPGGMDYIGAAAKQNEKAMSAAEKNSQRLETAISHAAEQTAIVLGNMLGGLLGNSQGSRVGAGILGGVGGAIGSYYGGIVGTQIGGAAGAALGSVIPIAGTLVGSIVGSAIGGLFSHHKKAIDNNTTALNNLTATLTNAPSGFKVASYNFNAADPKMVYRSQVEEARRQVARGGRTGFALQGAT